MRLSLSRGLLMAALVAPLYGLAEEPSPTRPIKVYKPKELSAGN